jgi:Protein of unknown function (DUF3617)
VADKKFPTMEDDMNRILLGMALLSSAAWAQSKFQPLNVKTGLWESTITSTTSGQMPIPSEFLQKLSPEQRAKVQARMNANSNSSPRTRTHTSKVCETKEKLAEQPFSSQQECKETVVNSTGSRMEMKVSCDFGDVKSSGTMEVEAISPEAVKGSGQMTSDGGGHAMTINTEFSSKWLSPSCGDVK